MKKQMRKIIISFALLFFIFAMFAPVAGAFVSENDNQQQNITIIAKQGDSGSNVKEIKIMLKAVGYMNYYGKPSVYYNTMTKYAVKYFQWNNGLNATGIVDQNTYDLLLKVYYAKTGASENVEPAPTSQSEPQSEPKPEPTPGQKPEVQPEQKPEPAPTPEPKPSPEEDNQSQEVAGLTADEQLMVKFINQERAKAGVAPLKIDMRLVESARVKSKDMIDNNYFSHTSPTLGSFSALIRKYAPDYSYLGENLAGNRSVQNAHTALMNSEGHRKNILNPNFTHLGIGIVDGGPYGKMFTQHFGG